MNLVVKNTFGKYQTLGEVITDEAEVKRILKSNHLSHSVVKIAAGAHDHALGIADTSTAPAAPVSEPVAAVV